LEQSHCRDQWSKFSGWWLRDDTLRNIWYQYRCQYPSRRFRNMETKRWSSSERLSLPITNSIRYTLLQIELSIGVLHIFYFTFRFIHVITLTQKLIFAHKLFYLQINEVLSSVIFIIYNFHHWLKSSSSNLLLAIFQQAADSMIGVFFSMTHDPSVINMACDDLLTQIEIHINITIIRQWYFSHDRS